MLLSGLLGNESAEKALLYIESYGQGYARKIADVYGVSLSQIQRQLERLERDGVLISQMLGKTRLYQINPRYFFKEELKALLGKALKNLPPHIKSQYFSGRTRPRRKGKPL
jgi:hypothetical protein